MDWLDAQRPSEQRTESDSSLNSHLPYSTSTIAHLGLSNPQVVEHVQYDINGAVAAIEKTLI